MNAHGLLADAIEAGSVVRSADVSAGKHPNAARTYLSDGSGVAWSVPTNLRHDATFAIDAEIPSVVRPALARRYGLTDPTKFAVAWTRAEALAKLFDTPIITWLARYGLALPAHANAACQAGTLAWQTGRVGDAVITYAVMLKSGESATAEATVKDGGEW